MLSSKSGNISRSGATFDSRLRSCSHWPMKLLTSASARSSAIIRRTCAASTPGCAQPRRPRRGPSALIRDAAPEEERQARRELDVADRMRGARRARRPDRARCDRGTTGWRGCARRRRGCRRRSLRRLARLLVERHRRLDVRRRHRAAVGASRQVGEDPLAQAALVGGGRRPADEQLARGSA